MDDMRFLTIGIIGAGYSGISVAANLQRFAQRPLHIMLFEKTKTGLGPAYSTYNPVHLLNIPAENMSAFPDRPDDFVNWLKNSSSAKNFLNLNLDLSCQYLPRMLYANYLKDILNRINDTNKLVNFEYVAMEVANIEDLQNHFNVILHNGNQIKADKIILAHGNLSPRNFFPNIHYPSNISNPWNYAAIEKINKHSPVLILGTGLSMVDVMISLLSQGHTAPIFAVSRRGLAPQSHQDFTEKFVIETSQLPRTLRELIKYFRPALQNSAANAKNWRAVFQALRPVTQDLWRSFNLREKQSFIKHLLPYWDSHRHRIAPDVAAAIALARDNEQLKILAGSVIAATKNGDSIQVEIKLRRKSSNELLRLNVSNIINCTGPSSGRVSETENSLLANLFTKGIIVNDELNLGLATTEEGLLLNKQGKHNGMFTLGPPCKGLLWECTAVPDIRTQSANLAKLLRNTKHC
jgi:uncharacterized NAD(P)/FAD-binding protein YdhS